MEEIFKELQQTVDEFCKTAEEFIAAMNENQKKLNEIINDISKRL